MVVLADLGSGNLRSLANAVRACGLDARVRSTPPAFSPRAVILPGVGAFGHAASALRANGWFDYLRRARQQGIRILGICLGMQLLFGSSEESPGAEGLGFIEGSVRRLDASRAKVPHMGWGRLRFTRGDPGAPGLEWAYFVHSFAADPADAGCVNCWADHGAPFPAVVSSGGVLGVQFHPEKSQAPGVRYLGSLLGGEP